MDNVLKAKAPSPQLSIGVCLESIRLDVYAKKREEVCETDLLGEAAYRKRSETEKEKQEGAIQDT